MKLTDSSQLNMTNDLDLFAVLLAEGLSVIFYNTHLISRYVCVPWIT